MRTSISRRSQYVASFGGFNGGQPKEERGSFMGEKLLGKSGLSCGPENPGGLRRGCQGFFSEGVTVAPMELLVDFNLGSKMYK